jgi:CHASE3 domain sensor protein
MPSQRILLGTSLAVLLVISAASIGLDLKSQSDKAWVDHTVGVLKKIADMRLLIRRAESAARGYLLTLGPEFLRDHEEAVAFRADKRWPQAVRRTSLLRRPPRGDGCRVGSGLTVL